MTKRRKHAKLRVFYLCIISWLEKRGVVQTLDDADLLQLERDIIEIRTLVEGLDEREDGNEDSTIHDN